MSGGLSRHKTVLLQKRNAGNVLFLDNGGLFGTTPPLDSQLHAKVGLDVFEFNKLDAMNVGQSEFRFGVDFLSKMASTVSYPFVSTNIISEVPLPWLKEHIVRTVGGVQVAILGVLPEDAFAADPIMEGKGVTIRSPEVAVKEALEAVQGQAQVIILLSQLNQQQTEALIEKFPEINLAVTRSSKAKCSMTSNPGQTLAPSSRYSQFFLSADITLSDNGEISVVQNLPVELSSSVAHNKAIDTMVTLPFATKQKMERKNETPDFSKGMPLEPMTEEQFIEAVKQRQEKLKALRAKNVQSAEEGSTE